MKTPETYEEFMEWLRPRTRIPEDPDECWIWRNAMTGNGVPSAVRNGKNINPRRELLNLRRSIPVGRMLVICRCESKRCINPKHADVVSVRALRQSLGAAGAYAGSRATMRAIARKHRSTLDLEKVASIRARVADGSATRAELAREFGVTTQTISNIVLHKTWAEAANGASVFAWRPAA